MPASMRHAFAIWRFQEPIETRTFRFTKGCHLMKVPTWGGMPGNEKPLEKTFKTQLFDLEKDPQQTNPFRDTEREAPFLAALDGMFQELDAPREQWLRLGLAQEAQTP